MLCTALYLGTRLILAMLWTGAVTLLLVGGTLDHGGHQLTCYAWSVMLGFGGSVVTGYVIVEHLIHEATERATRDIAQAVGVAVGEHLRETRSGVSRIR